MELDNIKTVNLNISFEIPSEQVELMRYIQHDNAYAALAEILNAVKGRKIEQKLMELLEDHGLDIELIY